MPNLPSFKLLGCLSFSFFHFDLFIYIESRSHGAQVSPKLTEDVFALLPNDPPAFTSHVLPFELCTATPKYFFLKQGLTLQPKLPRNTLCSSDWFQTGQPPAQPAQPHEFWDENTYLCCHYWKSPLCEEPLCIARLRVGQLTFDYLDSKVHYPWSGWCLPFSALYSLLSQNFY